MNKTKIEPVEAIDEFYKLKNAYETNYQEKYVKPILTNNRSKKEKRMEYSRLPKPECINCKRNVGTIFSVDTNNTTLIRTFIAKCGDIQDPCPLNIQIEMSKREQYYKFISDLLKKIEEIKLNIIIEKNNALFFSKDVTTIFEEFTDELKNYTGVTGQAIESNILKNNNPEKHLLLKRLIDEFSIGCILPFKQMISEYLANNDELILNNAVNLYINEMIPKLNQIRDLKYDVNMVDFNTETNIYTLIQLPNSLENSLMYYKSDDKVVKFVKGLKKPNVPKTQKLSAIVTTNNKTQKIRSKPTLIIEEDSEEDTNISASSDANISEDNESK